MHKIDQFDSISLPFKTQTLLILIFLYLSFVFFLSIQPDVGHNSEEKSWPWLESQWPIISGNVFSEYLLTSTKSSVVIINGHMRDVQCEFKDLKKSDVAVFAEPYKAWERNITTGQKYFTSLPSFLTLSWAQPNPLLSTPHQFSLTTTILTSWQNRGQCIEFLTNQLTLN